MTLTNRKTDTSFNSITCLLTSKQYVRGNGVPPWRHLNSFKITVVYILSLVLDSRDFLAVTTSWLPHQLCLKWTNLGEINRCSDWMNPYSNMIMHKFFFTGSEQSIGSTNTNNIKKLILSRDDVYPRMELFILISQACGQDRMANRNQCWFLPYAYYIHSNTLQVMRYSGWKAE